MPFALLKGEWTYRIMYFLSFNTLIVILSDSEGSHEILRAKALRMTQRQVIRNKIGKSSELSRVNTPR